MGDKESWVLAHSNTYLDKSFYDKIDINKIDQQQEVPVEIKAIDVWWMFNTSEGRRFLYKLSTVEDVAFVTAASSKTLIDFLW